MSNACVKVDYMKIIVMILIINKINCPRVAYTKKDACEVTLNEIHQKKDLCRNC